MRSATVRAAAVVAAVVGLLWSRRCAAAPAPKSVRSDGPWPPGPAQLEPTAAEILYGVSADDERWYNVLNQTVRMAKPVLDEPAAAAVLADLGLAGRAEFRVQPIVRHLVTEPGSTGTQYRFGVAAVGAGLACQLVRTVLLHTYFTGLYTVREGPGVRDVRQSLSKIQRAAAGYAGRLSFFGYHAAVGFLVDASRRLNALFAVCDDRRDNVPKTDVLAAIRDVCTAARALLGEHCAAAAERDIAPTVRVTSYTDKIFTDRAEVEDHQLMSMIENLDEYEYVDFAAADLDYWTKWLDVRPFVAHEKTAELTDDVDA